MTIMTFEWDEPVMWLHVMTEIGCLNGYTQNMVHMSETTTINNNTTDFVVGIVKTLETNTQNHRGCNEILTLGYSSVSTTITAEVIHNSFIAGEVEQWILFWIKSWSKNPTTKLYYEKKSSQTLSTKVATTMFTNCLGMWSKEEFLWMWNDKRWCKIERTIRGLPDLWSESWIRYIKPIDGRKLVWRANRIRFESMRFGWVYSRYRTVTVMRFILVDITIENQIVGYGLEESVSVAHNTGID